MSVILSWCSQAKSAHLRHLSFHLVIEYLLLDRKSKSSVKQYTNTMRIFFIEIDKSRKTATAIS